MTTQTPAGWYPDPYGEPQLRWWDGNQWTDATHAHEPQGPGPGPAQQPSGPQQPSQQPSGPQPSGPQQPSGPSSGPSSGPQQPNWEASPANPTLQFGQPTAGQSAYGQPAPPTQPWSGAQRPGAGYQQPGPGHPPPGGAPGQPGYGPSGYGQPGSGYGRPPGSGYGPPPKQGNPLPWVFGGLAALVVVALIVVAAIFFINRDATGDLASTPIPTETFETEEPPSQEPPSQGPPSQNPLPSQSPFPQPAGDRVSDPVSGLSFQVPNSEWKVPDPMGVNNGNPAEQQWSAAVAATSQENYEGENDWIGNVYTGLLNELYPYSGAASGLGDTAKSVFVDFSTKYYSMAHESKVVEDKAMKVGDRDAWVLQFELDFTKISEENGYKWKKENGAIVLIDRGEGQSPAIVYISVPDNLGTDVVGKVVSSLKPA